MSSAIPTTMTLLDVILMAKSLCSNSLQSFMTLLYYMTYLVVLHVDFHFGQSQGDVFRYRKIVWLVIAMY